MNRSDVWDFPNIEISHDEIAHGWRIRAGGLVVQIQDNGQLLISGRNARVLRSVLGLTGKRNAFCLSPTEIETADLENGGGLDGRIRKQPAANQK